MTEDVNTNDPVQQGDPPVQQSGDNNQTRTGSGDNIDWEKRYKGSVTKINELNATIKDLNAQLSDKSSLVEQLEAQLSAKDIEKDASVSEHKRLLEEALSNKSKAESELSELRAMRMKLDLMKEMGANELVPIIDRIPAVDDPEAMKQIMQDFKGWGNELVSEREKQLLSGEISTPSTNNTQTVAPQSSQEWEAHINNLPLGQEREKAWQDYWKWGASQES
jgi:chromosome segregation ATPase